MSYGLARDFRTFHRRQNGSALVELAISLIFLMTLLVGVMEFGFAMYDYHFVSYGVQQAGRYAIVHGAHWGSQACATASSYDCNATAGNVQDFVRGIASPGMNPKDITVSTTWPGTAPSGSSASCTTANADGCFVKVTVTYSFNVQFPLMPAATIPFSSSAQMVIQQ